MNIIRQDLQTVLFIHALRYFRRPINFPNAILRITKRELSLSLLKFPMIRKIARELGGGGHAVITVTGVRHQGVIIIHIYIVIFMFQAFDKVYNNSCTLSER